MTFLNIVITIVFITVSKVCEGQIILGQDKAENKWQHKAQRARAEALVMALTGQSSITTTWELFNELCMLPRKCILEAGFLGLINSPGDCFSSFCWPVWVYSQSVVKAYNLEPVCGPQAGSARGRDFDWMPFVFCWILQ